MRGKNPGSHKTGAGKSLLRINLKERPAFARANIGSRGFLLGSCKWGCSLRDSLQRVQGLLASPYPTNRLFTPNRAGYQATRKAPLLICNFLRVSLLTLICKPESDSYQDHFENCLQSLLSMSTSCFRPLCFASRLAATSREYQPTPFNASYFMLKTREGCGKVG